MKYNKNLGCRLSDDELKTLEKLRVVFGVEHNSKVIHELIRRAKETFLK